MDELQLKNDFCFLMSTLSAKSTNDYHSFNGSGTRLLYFVGSAVTKVQITYEVSTVSTLTICTLAFSALLHEANTRRIRGDCQCTRPSKSEFAYQKHLDERISYVLQYE